jgi:hypothetical protein
MMQPMTSKSAFLEVEGDTQSRRMSSRRARCLSGFRWAHRWDQQAMPSRTAG